MNTGTTATILGTVAAASSTIAFVPQITKIWKTGGKDVSYLMLLLYLAGVSLWLCYGLVIGAAALSWANAASMVFAGTCLALKRVQETKKAESSEAKQQRLRIAVDMDETIADSLTEHILRYNTEFGEQVTRDDLHGKTLEDLAPTGRREAVRRMVRNESFFERLAVMGGAQEVLQELARRHEVFIVTAAMEIPESFAAKYRWLERHFPFIPATNIVFCGNKGIIDADYLIDDEVRHFSRFRGTGILFSAPHNMHEAQHPRVNNWHELHLKFCREQSVAENRLTKNATYVASAVEKERA